MGDILRAGFFITESRRDAWPRIAGQELQGIVTLFTRRK